ncbi:MAG: DUF4130 domain-containing protein [Caulobacteraceae bacterium]
MIVFSDNPESIIKACILSKLTGDCIMSERSNNLLLFSGDAVINSDNYCIDDLAKQFKDYFLRNIDWVYSYKGNELKHMIYLALRHSSETRYSIIFKAIEDAFFKGINYCLQGASQYCKKLRSLESEVNHEVYRMMGFIRFKPAGDKCLAANPKLFHNTADLILTEFQKRYPYHRIVLITDVSALAIENGRIFEVNKNEYEKYITQDIYDSVWEEYYKSQYIESRKNIRLASSKIPKKYWDWMQEGKILKSEE